MNSPLNDYNSMSREQLAQECLRLTEELRREKRGWWATVVALILGIIVLGVAYNVCRLSG